MESKETPVRVQSGGTQVSRRTVARGVAWSAPIAAVAYAAPAFASSRPDVSAGQCGIACKHPGKGQNDKTYHFTFCFTVGTTAVVGNTITLGEMTVNGDAGRQAYSGTLADGTTPKTTVTVGAPNSRTCVYVDADGFGTSETGFAVLHYTYTLQGSATPIEACATAQITGDVCGTSTPGTPLQLQPDKWPHGDGGGATPDPGIIPCNTSTNVTCP
jgi:hypothetical protein